MIMFRNLVLICMTLVAFPANAQWYALTEGRAEGLLVMWHADGTDGVSMFIGCTIETEVTFFNWRKKFRKDTIVSVRVTIDDRPPISFLARANDENGIISSETSSLRAEISKGKKAMDIVVIGDDYVEQSSRFTFDDRFHELNNFYSGCN